VRHQFSASDDKSVPSSRSVAPCNGAVIDAGEQQEALGSDSDHCIKLSNTAHFPLLRKKNTFVTVDMISSIDL
jgi:hypothetical protein